MKWSGTARQRAAGTLLVAAVVGGLLGCRGGDRKRAPSDPPAAPPAPTPPAITLTAKAVADWGGVRTAPGEHGNGAALHVVTFDLAPQAPIQLRVPEGTKVEIAAPPPAPTVEPLAAGAYTFAPVPAQGAATGFRFATTTAAEPVKVEIAATPTGRYHFAIELGGHAFTDDVEVGDRCPPFALGPELGRTASPEARQAIRALSTELAARLATFAQPATMLRLVVLLFGDLVAIRDLEQAAHSQACGTASLEFVCARASCKVAQGASVLDMKRGDSYTIGVGTTVDFQGFGPE
jgi:hypothetical protein